MSNRSARGKQRETQCKLTHRRYHTRMGLALVATSLLGLAGLSGCSGGSADASSGSGSTIAANSTTRTQSFGPLITRMAGIAQTPVISGGVGVTVTGIAGTTISGIALANPALTATNSTSLLRQATRIVYEEGKSVYVINPDGSNRTRLTTDMYPTSQGPFNYPSFLSPTWSPDGSQIAWSRWTDSQMKSQIFVMNADGTNPHQITNEPTNAEYPVWSPNGTKIAFHRIDSTLGKYQIFSINLDGTGVTRISTGGYSDMQPCWSPDGNQIAFIRYDPSVGYYQLYIMNADGTNAHRALTISNNTYRPAWSPKGTKIAFSYQPSNTGSRIAVTDVASAGFSLLTNTSTNSISDDCPSWSPDGSQVVFTRYNGSNVNVYSAPTDLTSPPTQLTYANSYVINSPSWSPYATSRNIVGTGGALGTSAAGFLFGQSGDVMTSLVVFNAATPTDTRIVAQDSPAPYQPNVVFTVTSGNNLTALSYINGPFGGPVNIIGSGGPVTNATSAVVSFNASTGTVSAILPYAEGRAAQKESVPQRDGKSLVLRRSFLGIWDATGKNLAPRGASEVQIDAQTGKLLSFK